MPTTQTRFSEKQRVSIDFGNGKKPAYIRQVVWNRMAEPTRYDVIREDNGEIVYGVLESNIEPRGGADV